MVTPLGLIHQLYISNVHTRAVFVQFKKDIKISGNQRQQTKMSIANVYCKNLYSHFKCIVQCTLSFHKIQIYSTLAQSRGLPVQILYKDDFFVMLVYVLIVVVLVALSEAIGLISLNTHVNTQRLIKI